MDHFARADQTTLRARPRLVAKTRALIFMSLLAAIAFPSFLHELGDSRDA